MTPRITMTNRSKNVRSELDTGRRYFDQLKHLAKQLSDRINLHVSKVLDEYSELYTATEHDQTLVNKSHEFSPPPQAALSLAKSL